MTANPGGLIETPQGPARAHVRLAERPAGTVVLGHGAAGGVGAPDLRAAADAAIDAGFSVILVEQPYLVAGRRSPPAAPRLDAAWLSVIANLRESAIVGPLVCGGRSAGARVACRTAAEAGAMAILCLAFPLQPAGGARSSVRSRLPELDAVPVPVLVVQGENDRFGIPPDGPGRTVVRVPGDHALKSRASLNAVAAAVAAWLRPAIAELTARAPARSTSLGGR